MSTSVADPKPVPKPVPNTSLFVGAVASLMPIPLNGRSAIAGVNASGLCGVLHFVSGCMTEEKFLALPEVFATPSPTLFVLVIFDGARPTGVTPPEGALDDQEILSRLAARDSAETAKIVVTPGRWALTRDGRLSQGPLPGHQLVETAGLTLGRVMS